MTQTILLKGNGTAGNRPSTSTLQLRELAINYADGTISLRKGTGVAGDQIITIGATASTANQLATARTIAASGDAVWTVSFDGSSNQTGVLTLANTGVTAGTYNSVSVNSKGLITSGSNQSYLTANQTVTLSGDISGSGTTAITATLPNVATAGTGLPTINAKGLTTSVAPLSSSNVTTALGFTPANSALVGAASGIATLDNNSRLSASQIPTALLGAVVFISTWDASANSPSLASGTGTKGNYYLCSKAGTTNLDGYSNWAVNDMALFDGTVWQHISGSATTVSSVNGQIGAVSITSVSGNAGTASALATPQNIALTGAVTGSASFSGSSATSIATTLPTSGVTSGTYAGIQVASSGLVTSATALTTCAQYGITDALTTSSIIDGGSF